MKKLISYYHLVLNLHKMTINEEVILGLGIRLTGDPDATAPPYTQVQLQTLGTTVQTDLGNRITDPHVTLTDQEQIDVDALSRALIAVKNYVEQVANAKAKGNRAVFDTIANRIGITSKQPHKQHPRVFESLTAEAGSFHVRVPSEGTKGQGITYYFDYGITTAKNVMPAIWQKSIALPVTELIVTGLPSGTIIGLRYAALLHPQHTTKSDAKALPASNVSVAVPVNKAGKVSLTHGIDFLHYSDIIYITIT